MEPMLASYSPADQKALYRLADARAWELGIGVTLPSGLALTPAAAASLIERVYADPYIDVATRDALAGAR